MSGVFTRAEILRLGHTDGSIRRLVDSGALTRLRNGWYATLTADPEVVAAVARGGALSCASALKRHGFWVAPGYTAPHVTAPHIRGPRGRQLPGFCRHHGRGRPVRGPVDPVDLALACAAKCMSAEDFIVVADSVLNSRAMTTEDLRRALTGLIDARTDRLLDNCDPRAQSGTETLTRIRLRSRGYKVVVQPDRPSGGHSDLAIGRLILECDSKQHHTSIENYEKDRWQDRKSLLAGRFTIRLTYSMVMHQWDEVFTDIEAFVRADRHRTRQRTH